MELTANFEQIESNLMDSAYIQAASAQLFTPKGCSRSRENCQDESEVRRFFRKVEQICTSADSQEKQYSTAANSADYLQLPHRDQCLPIDALDLEQIADELSRDSVVLPVDIGSTHAFTTHASRDEHGIDVDTTLGDIENAIWEVVLHIELGLGMFDN